MLCYNGYCSEGKSLKWLAGQGYRSLESIPLSSFLCLEEETNMDFINGKLKPIYFKYLAAAFGSALITSIYSIVDMAIVGQYQGPDGTAALAVVAPIWNIIFSLGLLMGIGGSIIFSTWKGSSDQNTHSQMNIFQLLS